MPWPTSFKEQVVLETLVPGASVSAIARQHDIDTSLIYRWRRQFRVEKVDGVGGGRFLPVAISDQVPGTPGKTEVATRTAGRSKPRRTRASRIEIEYRAATSLSGSATTTISGRSPAL
ncbi:transposase [Aurantimonas sp. C2-3-R2]|uniref:transposase n=1 Tax=unclassified Aurantimonas TaxID=2638230 RepID=UPI003FA49D14